MGSEIIVCQRRFDIDHQVVTFEEEGGYSAYVPHCTDNISRIYATHPARGLARRATRYRARRLMGGSSRLELLRQVVRQVTVHLDGCLSAAQCFDVLHNQRGLSVHFMIDNDGTIYQTLDLMHCAFHAAGVNEVAIGIELQNRGDAARHANAYRQKRPTVTCRVHGAQFLSYDFTDAQYEAMVRLGAALSRIFDLPLAVPRSSSGPIWTTIANPRAFRGFLGHYHISRNKWDPGPFDFPRLFGRIGSGVTFPLTPLSSNRRVGHQQPPSVARWYFDNSEQDAPARFPLGPLGSSRLWHGGAHLRAQEGRRVFSIAQGRIVAARLGPPCPVGSCNFVLVRHQLSLLNQPVSFFSLYYHLGALSQIEAGEHAAPWLRDERLEPHMADLLGGTVVMLDIEVGAGEVVGQVAEAGPPGHREGQLHFSMFSQHELTNSVDPGRWEVLESSDNGRLCNDPQLIRRVDRRLGKRPPDGKLSRRELRNFFTLNAQREDLRRMAVRHRSEWTPGDWAQSLEQTADFGRLPAGQRRRLIAQQIEPTLWWTDEIAAHAGLPADGMVYSYHPIGFVRWLERITSQAASLRSAGIEGADRWEGRMAPSHLTVDAESADEMTDQEDFYSGELGKQLTLEDLARGYPED